jgi:hypothetical protein
MYYAEKSAPSPYPYAYAGMRGMGQMIPGIRPETQRLVVYGSLALVGAAIAFFVIMRTQSSPSPEKEP